MSQQPEGARSCSNTQRPSPCAEESEFDSGEIDETWPAPPDAQTDCTVCKKKL